MPETIPTPAQSSGGAAAKPRGRPFPKGTSGNPGGSSKLRKEASRQYLAACPKAAGFLVSVLDDTTAPLALRVRVAELITLRGLGRIPDAPAPGEQRAQTLVLVQSPPGTPARDEDGEEVDDAAA